MTNKNIWLMVGTPLAALVLACFMPATASASNTCCVSRWSANVSDSSPGPQYCNISRGYISGGVQHNLYVNADIDREVGRVDSIIAAAYGNSSNGYSPGVRVKGHCKNTVLDTGPTTFKWSGDSSASAWIDCDSGVDWAECQSQVSDADPNSGCTATCL